MKDIFKDGKFLKEARRKQIEFTRSLVVKVNKFLLIGVIAFNVLMTLSMMFEPNILFFPFSINIYFLIMIHKKKHFERE